jgi:tungstate transport system substrate-binding protein
MPQRRPAPLAVVVALGLLLACSGSDPDRDVILATTTSTQDSGLLDALVPLFEERTGLRVKTIAVGTGEALAMARRGDADVVLAHAPTLERESVAEGFTVNRRRVMHNDFVVVGPAADPARIHGGNSGAEALTRIAAAGSAFASRGDRSGTHFREQKLWKAAGIDPVGDWYFETGQGMGGTLLVASARGAYALSDRGTHLALRERTELVPHVEGDPALLNVYSVMEVNPERFPEVNQEGARAFADFLWSEEARAIIESFGAERFGEPLFFLEDDESLRVGGG